MCSSPHTHTHTNIIIIIVITTISSSTTSSSSNINNAFACTFSHSPIETPIHQHTKWNTQKHIQKYTLNFSLSFSHCLSLQLLLRFSSGSRQFDVCFCCMWSKYQFKFYNVPLEYDALSRYSESETARVTVVLAPTTTMFGITQCNQVQANWFR